MNSVGDPRDATRARTSDFVQALTGVQSRLYAYICSLLGEAASARDVLQDTNLALWDKARDYDPARPFTPWAYRVAYLQVLAYRKRCTRSRLLFDEQLMSELAEEAARNDDDVDLRLEALGDCLKQLAGSGREMIDHRYLRGESVDRIAARLHKTPNVVAAALYRIRRRLHECIETKLAVE